jgi:hypothetical protein
VQAFEGSVESFVVSGKSAETSGPGEASFDNPSPWQQHEASFGHRVLDDFQAQTVLLCSFSGVRSGAALIDISQFHGAAGHILHLLGKRGNLLAVALIGRRHGQRQEMTQRADRDVKLRPFPPFGPVVACPRAALGRGL